ncbi:hypothetical protein [Novosphingobium album (ex Hu et al. 2023)]|uniref:Terminase n=1 Tax=Novosphingobium album (ex Hu et al. 2023) TaxID=2930093 RepID=A0ABT0B0X0_9SPHN|nr:hypothetical protein [Novosphingobium album (ex Hu et al. 2023)]MCJ2178670.1 hypothetical protein [Novosphingobium album (ex Hu et al. 2023)]
MAKQSARLRPSQWRKPFLAELAATSNVSAAARKVQIGTARAYELRRTDPEFYREWQEALCEGYDHLEMSLLQRLREGEIKPAPGAKRGTRVFDNATAFRLLVAHRETAARQRAIYENRNSEAILDAINAKIEKMRERRTNALPAPQDAGSDGAE